MLLKCLSSLVLAANIAAVGSLNFVFDSNLVINKMKIDNTQQDISVKIEPYEQVKKWFYKAADRSRFDDTIKNDFLLHDFKTEGLTNIKEIQKKYKEIKFNPNLIYLQAKGQERQQYNGLVSEYPVFDSELRTNNNSTVIKINDIVIKNDDELIPNKEVVQLEYNGSWENKYGYAYSHSWIALQVYFKEDTKLYCQIVTQYRIECYSTVTSGSVFIWSNLYLETYSLNGTASIIAY